MPELTSELISSSTGISHLRSVINEGYIDYEEIFKNDIEAKGFFMLKEQCDILIPLVVELEREILSLRANSLRQKKFNNELMQYLTSLVTDERLSHREVVGLLAIYLLKHL